MLNPCGVWLYAASHSKRGSHSPNSLKQKLTVSNRLDIPDVNETIKGFLGLMGIYENTLNSRIVKKHPL